ncbi:hypothetical protein ACA910_007288 [Epithemia clementina (nom. ined.)]
MMAARHFAVQRDLIALRQQRRHPHYPVTEQQQPVEKWLDTQERINQVVQVLQQRIRNNDPNLNDCNDDIDEDDQKNDGRPPSSSPPLNLTVVQPVELSQHVPQQQQSPTQLRCLGLFRALRHKSSGVRSLSLVGLGPQLQTDGPSAQALAQALPFLTRLHLTHLSILADNNCLLDSLCQALTTTATQDSNLQELRLTFGDEQVDDSDDEYDENDASNSVLDLSRISTAQANTKRLLKALTQCSSLQSLHLFGLNLRRCETTDLVTMIRDGLSSLRELRLVNCRLCNVQPLCQAIRDTQQEQRDRYCAAWTKIDLSKNRIRDCSAVAPLLDTPGLVELSLSQNLLTGDKYDSAKVFCQALAQNTTLRRLNLDLNPWSHHPFGPMLCTVLQRDNTTLLRLSMVVLRGRGGGLGNIANMTARAKTPLVLISHACVEQMRLAVALNEAGRQWLRQEPKAQPRVLGRLVGRDQPSLVYGLLQERPPGSF